MEEKIFNSVNFNHGLIFIGPELTISVKYSKRWASTLWDINYSDWFVPSLSKQKFLVFYSLFLHFIPCRQYSVVHFLKTYIELLKSKLSSSIFLKRNVKLTLVSTANKIQQIAFTKFSIPLFFSNTPFPCPSGFALISAEVFVGSFYDVISQKWNFLHSCQVNQQNAHQFSADFAIYSYLISHYFSNLC